MQVVQTDTFLNPVFKESFKRVFAPPGEPGALDIASNATFEVRQLRRTRFFFWEAVDRHVSSRTAAMGCWRRPWDGMA